jgi:YfiH family protein
MPFEQKDGLRFFQFDSMMVEWLDHGIFTRVGGVSSGPYKSLNVGANVGDPLDNVLENKRRIFSALNRSEDSTYDIWQVHSARIFVAREPRQDEPYPKADGLITDRTGLTLSMRFADCVPIMLVDPGRRAIGLVHAGWQGTLLGAAPAGVNKMVEAFDSDPSDLIAGIGPAIRQHHYPVGQEVVEAYRENFGAEAEPHFMRKNGQNHLDLIGANIALLRKVGLNQIEDAGLCTACNLDDWFSHRGQAGSAGRFTGVIGLK